MIVVNAVIESTPEDIAALREAIGKMETASRAESGCLDYTFSVEVSNPASIRITEKWESVEILKAHFATPHMAEFQAAMGGHPPKSMQVTFYEAEEIQPL